MAGAILASVVTSVLKRLSTLTPKASTSSAEQELQKLERTMERIQAVLEDAEEKGVSDRSEQLRLRELKEVAYDAEDAVDEYEYEVLHAKVEARRWARVTQMGNKQVTFYLNSYNHKVPISDELVRRVKEIRQRFEEMTDDWKRLDLCLLEKSGKRRRIEEWKPKETASQFDEAKTFGRDDEKNEILKWLLQEDESNVHSLSVLCIVGMGGLGKTTLAQMSYNDPRVRQHFNLRGWVYVSEDFDIANLVKKICISFGKNMYHINELMSLDQLHQILNLILNGKKFFLVLDDVWNQKFELWSSLKTLLTGIGVGKILVTTRDQHVAKIMQTTSHINLSHLSFNDSWLLFKKIAYECSTHNFLEIGKKIVNKCKGLPLAVKVLAGILRKEDEEEVWNVVLESELWELDEEKDDIFPVLKLSYEHLPVELKQCFMYLSLFSKGSIIDKSIIIQQWMSHGFIQAKGNKVEEDVGNNYCNELLHRSILQYYNDESFKMHDLLHDLAQSVAKDEYLLMNALKSHNRIPKTIRHVCMQKYVNLEPLSEAKHLRTLILTDCDGEIQNMNFLYNLTCLRTLVLPMGFLGDLQESIGNMKHLRYLDIAVTKSIPAPVYNLHHLNTLKFYNFSIELSTDIGGLIKLRHLDGNSQMWYHPSREIVALTNLQTLPRICLTVESDDENELLKLRDLKGLPNLRGMVDVRGLGTVAWADVTPPEAYLKNTRGIQHLQLGWEGGVADADERLAAQVLDSLQPHRSLIGLRIYHYPGVLLPTWLGHELPALDYLWIYGARRVKSFVVAVEEFSSLNPPAAVSASTSTEVIESRRCFRSLQDLSLDNMDELEEWRGVQDRDLPRLRQLKISSCPKLRKLPSLSHLSTLKIIACPELKSLPSLSLLTELHLNGEFSSDLLLGGSCLPMLRSLSIEYYKDESLIFPDDGSLKQLEKLSISFCYALTSVEGLGGLASLHKLSIYDCPLLSTWRSTSTSLHHLEISKCPLLRISVDERLPRKLRDVKISESPGAEEWYRNQVLDSTRMRL